MRSSGTKRSKTGADANCHRRDLWEAIEAGEYPKREAFQLFTEEQADTFSFDVLDSAKLIPEDADLSRDQQPARRVASAGHPPRQGGVRAEFTGGWLPVSGGCGHRLRLVPRAECARTRCAVSPRSSQSTTSRQRSSSRARRLSSCRESAHRGQLPLRSEQADGGGDSRTHVVVARQCFDRVGRRGADGLGMDAPRR